MDNGFRGLSLFQNGRMTDLPRRRFGLFTRAEAQQAGLSDAQLRSRRYRRVLYGVYADSTHAPSSWLRLDAALLVAPQPAVVARHSAAAIWQGVTPYSSAVHLNLPPHRQMRVPGVDARRTQSADVVQVDGRTVTTPAQTFCELATDLNLVQLVTFGDSLVKNKALTVDGLQQHAREWRGKQAALARRAAQLVRPGVDSPRESASRVLVVLAGLPEPEVNLKFYRDDGSVMYRLDMGYRASKVGFEYDGRQHAESSKQWQWDIERRRWFEAQGWHNIVITDNDLYREPRNVLGLLARALMVRGCAARIRSDEWCRFFPGRKAS